MWVITRAINDYNQDGEYFVSAFVDKPSEEQIGKATGFLVGELTNHIFNGGGRRSTSRNGITFMRFLKVKHLPPNRLIYTLAET